MAALLERPRHLYGAPCPGSLRPALLRAGAGDRPRPPAGGGRRAADLLLLREGRHLCLPPVGGRGRLHPPERKEACGCGGGEQPIPQQRRPDPRRRPSGRRHFGNLFLSFSGGTAWKSRRLPRFFRAAFGRICAHPGEFDGSVYFLRNACRRLSHIYLFG